MPIVLLMWSLSVKNLEENILQLYSTAFLIGPKQKMIHFWILFLFFAWFCAGVESESEYDDYYEYYDEKEQKISAEWKTLATEMFEGMS